MARPGVVLLIDELVFEELELFWGVRVVEGQYPIVVNLLGDVPVPVGYEMIRLSNSVAFREGTSN